MNREESESEKTPTKNTSSEPTRKWRARKWLVVLLGVLLALIVGFLFLKMAWPSDKKTTEAGAPVPASTNQPSTSEGDGVPKDPSVSQVGEPPMTTVPEGELPNKDINPLAAGIDPCKVLSQADVVSAVGRVGEARATGGGTGCEYPSNGGSKAVVSVVRGDSAAKYEATLQDVRQQAAESLKLVEGIGDSAFAYETPGVLASAEARRGELRYRVVVVGESAKRDQVETLLRKAVSAKPS